MKIAYLDCPSGISGDMMLGALVDAGVPLAELQSGIDSLALPDCELKAEEVQRHGFRATKIHVLHAPEHAHRHLHHITDLIQASHLTQRQKELAIAIFTRLGKAEAHVHGTSIEKVHFHEVGAVDSIADIVGTAIGWDLLKAEQLVCSPIPTGHGFIQIAHGRTSVPAPATAELLKGIPLAPCDVASELTTPTGAAIVATLADQFGALPPIVIDRIGYGAGDRDFPEQANITRLMVGSTDTRIATAGNDVIEILETNLDDVTAETIAFCCQRLRESGARDTYATAIQMKKGRPAFKLTVLCDTDKRHEMEQILFHETGTLGIRNWTAKRAILPRQPHTVTTRFGTVLGKLATLPDGTQRFAPEFDACEQIARAQNIAIDTVFTAARNAFDSAP